MVLLLFAQLLLTFVAKSCQHNVWSVHEKEKNVRSRQIIFSLMAPGWIRVRINDPLLLRITRNVKQAVENGYSWQIDYAGSPLIYEKTFYSSNINIRVMHC